MNKFTMNGDGIAEMLLIGDVGDPWDGITAKDVTSELESIVANQINVHIASYGGDVNQGTAIYNALKRSPAKIVTSIEFAASIASVIAMAGDEVEIAENGVLMIHSPMSGLAGGWLNASNWRELAEEALRQAVVLDTVGKAMAVAYSRSNLTEEEIAAAMSDETWYGPAEAVEAGFADRIGAEVAMVASAKTLTAIKEFNNAPKPFVAILEQAISQRGELEAIVEKQSTTPPWTRSAMRRLALTSRGSK